MRKLLVALLLTGATAHADPPMCPAEQRELVESKRLALEAELVVIADRDIQTARIEQDNARVELAQIHHDARKTRYWQARFDQARADEQEAFTRYLEHRAGRENARLQLRKAIAEARQLKEREARR